MSDKKIFAIDPNIFKISNNTTRKKREQKPKEKLIKMKAQTIPKKNTSMKKRSIINMMRQHQADKYNNTFNSTNVTKPSQTDITDRNNDFNNAKNYFNNLKETVKKNTNSLNHTIKQTPTYVNHLNTNIPALNTNTLNDVSNMIQTKITDPSVNINPNIHPTPKYGCLKNGLLPTYRTLMNQTRKNIPNIVGGGNTNTNTANTANTNTINTNTANTATANTATANTANTNTNELVKTAIRNEQVQHKLNNINKNKLKYKKKKQKKTIRRTFKTGRSKTMPKISVLVSNKTIRNNISTKTLLMKQIPIYEIRKYLIKHGFIRVGSITPNDVLRKMYESAMLICGEIQNHNPDNLLYNFLHDTDTN